MEKLKRINEKTWNFCAYISGIMMFCVAVMVLVNVILRRLTSCSIIGCTELVRYFMCIAASFALMQNEWVDGNVRVTIILEALSEKKRKVLDLVCYIITSVGFIFITCFMCRQAVEALNRGAQTTDLFMPMWIFSAILALGFVFLTLCFWSRAVLKAYALVHSEKEGEKMT